MAWQSQILRQCSTLMTKKCLKFQTLDTLYRHFQPFKLRAYPQHESHIFYSKLQTIKKQITSMNRLQNAIHTVVVQQFLYPTDILNY